MHTNLMDTPMSLEVEGEQRSHDHHMITVYLISYFDHTSSFELLQCSALQ